MKRVGFHYYAKHRDARLPQFHHPLPDAKSSVAFEYCNHNEAERKLNGQECRRIMDGEECVRGLFKL